MYLILDEDFAKFAEKIKENTTKTTRIEMAPLAKAYTVDIKDIYTELTLEQIENQPTGPESKKIEDYKDLFAKRTDPKETEFTEFPAEKILMKADPGMGKTTHGKKIAYDWVKGVFTAVSVVFFVSMKLIRPGDAIENVIVQQTPTVEKLTITPKKLKDILDPFSDRCLIIFDGFDEFYSKNEDVLKVIRGQKLLNCNIIVTSRPHSVEDNEEHFHTIVKIRGFSEEYATKYVSKLLRQNDKVDVVIKFNFRNFVIGGDTFTCPMLLLFICILVNSDEIDLRTENYVPLGEIYWRLLRCIYSKYRLGIERDFHVKGFIEVLRKIGQLAFKTFESKQAWFKRSEIVSLIGEDAFEYGLLIGHEDFRLVGPETADVVVTFAHRSIEQFLGAFHITQRFSAGDSVSTSLLWETIMFHFCIWLIIENETKVVGDKTKAFSLLQVHTNMSLDVPVLDFSILQRLSSVLSFREAVKRKDATVIKFLEYSLSHCYRIQHLTLSTTDPISNVLPSLRLSGPLPVQLKSVHIVDDYYTKRDIPLGHILHQFMTSPGTKIILRVSLCVEVEHLVEETSWVLGNPSLVLLTKLRTKSQVLTCLWFPCEELVSCALPVNQLAVVPRARLP